MKFCSLNSFLCLVVSSALIVSSGCRQKIVDKRASSQRYFLEKIMVESGHVDPAFKVFEKNIVAHNGFGWVDISGLTNSTNDNLTSFQKSMVRMVLPKGNLEGYARVTYAVELDQEAVVAKYFLMKYPIDYLQKSEVSSSAVEVGEEIVLNPGKDMPSKKTLLEDSRKVSMEKLDISKDFQGKVAYRVKARGIIVDISAANVFSAQAEKYADLVAARIEKEITERYALLGEVIESRGDRPPPKVGLKGFMGHLEEHLDMGRQEYQPFRKKF
ncbi:MAG: hypothetical protein ACYTFY_00605 [Planctomycetota bacterium]|jgi:hypothetical protein